MFIEFSSVAQDEVLTGSEVPVTQTQYGKIRGYIHNGINTIKGIPYATAKRFGASVPPEAWDDIKSTTMFGPVAPLLNPTIAIQDESEFVFDHDWGFPNEDCSSLNIWTLEATDAKKRPVLFWIHGGGFTFGPSHELPSYDGEDLAK